MVKVFRAIGLLLLIVAIILCFWQPGGWKVVIMPSGQSMMIVKNSPTPYRGYLIKISWGPQKEFRVYYVERPLEPQEIISVVR